MRQEPGVRADVERLEFYQAHATEVLLPFWTDRALDERNGGVYTCFNNTGDTLVSTDKYTWSQGRFLWILSRLAALCSEGALEGNVEGYLTHAGKTARFLQDHAILENGNCAFLLSETGEPVESVAGQGLDTSFYADCFVVLGFSEFARVTSDTAALDFALTVYDRIEQRLTSGDLRSEPYPVPAGYRSHSIPMIMLNVSQELFNSLESFDHWRTPEFRGRELGYAATIMSEFRLQDGTVMEMLPDDREVQDTVLARHVNPGHTLESMWFVLSGADEDRYSVAWDVRETIRETFALGWDNEYGGFLRFVDRKGGRPRGEEIGDQYERLILDTWDMKLWWPHAEALYATLLASELTQDEDLRALYEKTHEYTFRTFPNPNAEVGEWVQIRDRRGRPVEKLVALPVKDPYHILRSVLLIIELLSRKLRKNGFA